MTDTLRDRFAIAAMQGLLAGNAQQLFGDDEFSEADAAEVNATISEIAFNIADSMLAERAKVKP